MSRINDEFMETYKRIDQFCRDAYGVEKGVTTYIELMRSKIDGYRYVSGWQHSLDQLVKYRKIRNDYTHEVGSSYANICSSEDVEWLEEFHNKLMHAEDPLTIYKKAKNPPRTINYTRKEHEPSEKTVVLKEEKKGEPLLQPATTPTKRKGKTLKIILWVLLALFLLADLILVLTGIGVLGVVVNFIKSLTGLI